jgi:hypothetical protein
VDIAGEPPFDSDKWLMGRAFFGFTYSMGIWGWREQVLILGQIEVNFAVTGKIATAV